MQTQALEDDLSLLSSSLCSTFLLPSLYPDEKVMESEKRKGEISSKATNWTQKPVSILNQNDKVTKVISESNDI